MSAGSVAAAPVDLAYRFGTVMQAGTQAIPIFWEPAHLQDGTASAVDPNYNSLIQRFLGDFGGHGLYNNLTQYYQANGPGTQYIVNSSGLLTAIVDTSSYPSATGDCVTNAITNCITDAQIQTEVANQITAGSLPKDYKTMYPVFTDPLEASCADATDCFNPVPPQTNWVYCAYHGYFTIGGRSVMYENMPYLDSNAYSIGGCTGGATHPNGNSAFDDETSALSHELNETITDPDFAGWYDASTGNEIADICNQQIAKVTWGSNQYIVQKEWSNATGSCVAGGDNRLSLSAKGGPAGSSTKVTGRGFLAAKTVRLSFSDADGTVTRLGHTKSDGSGAFSAMVSIPGGAPDGHGTLDATGANPGDGASAAFSVGPAVSTFRPDAMIGLTRSGPWIGGRVYNTSGVRQTLLRNVVRGRSSTSWVKIQNRGNVADTFSLKGPAATAGFTVTYKVGSSTKTAAVEAGTYSKTLESGSFFFMKVIVGVKGSTAVGKSFHGRLLVSSLGKPTKQDAVVASVHAE
jgi:hypothetical protein